MAIRYLFLNLSIHRYFLIQKFKRRHRIKFDLSVQLIVHGLGFPFYITVKYYNFLIKIFRSCIQDRDNCNFIIIFWVVIQSVIQMQSSDWSGPNQVEEEISDLDAQPQKPKEDEYKMEEIVSERVTGQIEDDLTTLRNKKFQTPLSFYGKVGSSYLFSFRKKELGSFLGRFFCLAVFLIGASIAIYKIATVPQKIKLSLLCLTATQLVTFLLLFFLDPGTLFEDEQQKIDQERLYCQTCRIYRSYNSSHCLFCVKCVKGYDHHCGFFSKCIARRNLAIFYLFITCSIACGVLSIGSLVYTIMKSAVMMKQ